MVKKRTEPPPHAFWYKVTLELPVTTASFSRDQARSKVIDVVEGMAAALAVASGTVFLLGKPRVKVIQKGPRLSAE
jgi:hypothetical protein